MVYSNSPNHVVLMENKKLKKKLSKAQKTILQLRQRCQEQECCFRELEKILDGETIEGVLFRAKKEAMKRIELHRSQFLKKSKMNFEDRFGYLSQENQVFSDSSSSEDEFEPPIRKTPSGQIQQIDHLYKKYNLKPKGLPLGRTLDEVHEMMENYRFDSAITKSIDRARKIRSIDKTWLSLQGRDKVYAP